MKFFFGFSFFFNSVNLFDEKCLQMFWNKQPTEGPLKLWFDGIFWSTLTVFKFRFFFDSAPQT